MRKIIITWVLLSAMLMPTYSVCALTWSEICLQWGVRLSVLSNPAVSLSSTADQELDQNRGEEAAIIPQPTAEACDEDDKIDDEVDSAAYGILLFLVPFLMYAHYK